MTETPTREDAWTLLNEYTDNPSLLKHALSVAYEHSETTKKRSLS